MLKGGEARGWREQQRDGAGEAGAGRRRSEKAPSVVLNPPRTRLPCPRSPGLWKKLRCSQKKPLKLLPAGFCHGLVQLFSDTWKGSRVRGAAVVALQEGCAARLLALLEEWRLCALHAERSTVQSSDVNLVRCLQTRRD